MQIKTLAGRSAATQESKYPTWCARATHKHASKACKSAAALHHRSLPHKISLVQGMISAAHDLTALQNPAGTNLHTPAVLNQQRYTTLAASSSLG
jgi:hypothetical protein